MSHPNIENRARWENGVIILMMKIGQTTRVLSLLTLTALAASAMAYEQDTHFQVTYIICRTAGFTHAEALKVAAADQGVDDSSGTEANSGILPKATDEWMWHAFDHVGNMGASGIIARKERMFKAAEEKKSLKLLGVFFHYQQDTWAHRHHHDGNVHSYSSYTTYTTPFGHAGAGHQPDRPPFDPETAMLNLEDGFKYAKAFLVDALHRQPRPFVANYVPIGGSIDHSWSRNGADFHILKVAGAPNSAQRFFNEIIRNQCECYGCTTDPMYSLHDTADEADLTKTRNQFNSLCAAYKAQIGELIEVPTLAEKHSEGFGNMTTEDLISEGMPKN